MSHIDLFSYFQLGVLLFFSVFCFLFVRFYFSLFFLICHDVIAKRTNIYLVTFIVSHRIILYLKVTVLVLSFILVGDDHKYIFMDKNQIEQQDSTSQSVKQKADCIFERLRSEISRIGSAGALCSHIFFVFGASV